MTNLIHNRRPYKSLTARTAVIVAGMLSVTAAHADTATQPSNRPTNLQLGASVVYSDKGYRNYDGNTNVIQRFFMKTTVFMCVATNWASTLSKTVSKILL